MVTDREEFRRHLLARCPEPAGEIDYAYELAIGPLPCASPRRCFWFRLWHRWHTGREHAPGCPAR